MRSASMTFCLLTMAILLINPVTGRAAIPEDQSDDVTVEKDKPKSAPKPRQNADRIRPESLRIRVVHSHDELPVERAQIKLQMYGEKTNHKADLITDAKGEVTFEYPDGDLPTSLNLYVRRAGLVAEFVNFGNRIAPAALPTEKTIRLETGKKIGGTVVDQNGQPVAGAQLSILTPSKDSPTEIYYHLFNEKSNDDGTWLLDGAPVNAKNLHLRIEHPRFVHGSQSVQDRVDGLYRLDPGIRLTGRVTDQNGKVVPDAHVTVGRDRWGSVRSPTPVDEKGSYILYALKPETTWVTVEAAEFAPQAVQVNIDAKTKPVDFELTPGQVTRIKVVDLHGEPVSGIRIYADTWKKLRPLWWHATTDAQGMAVWKGAPAEPVEFDLVARGFMSIRNVSLDPQDDPYIIAISRTIKIEGTVVDDKKAKIPEFPVSVGWDSGGNGKVYWGKQYDVKGHNGNFEIEIDEALQGMQLRIEIPGYRTWTSDLLSTDKSPHKLFVRLEREAGPGGVVLSPDGQPGSNARLALITPKQHTQFSYDLPTQNAQQSATSDAAGHFAFSSIDDAYMVVAMHETGYAEISRAELEKAGTIRLQPWAVLEVTVRQGRQPIQNKLILTRTKFETDSQFRNRTYEVSGKTAADGRVTFEHLVPLTNFVSVSFEQSWDRSTTIYSERMTKVELEPGITAHVEFGGSGAVVHGQLVVEGESRKPHRWRNNDPVMILSKAQTSAERKHYRCLIDDDGKFRLDDLPPGKYEFRVSLTAIPEPDHSGPGDRIGTIQTEFEVREQDATVDLGMITGQWSK